MGCDAVITGSVTNVLVKPAASIFRVILWLCFNWADEISIYVKETQTPTQHWQTSSRLHGVIFQETAIFIFHSTVSIKPRDLKLNAQ